MAAFPLFPKLPAGNAAIFNDDDEDDYSDSDEEINVPNFDLGDDEDEYDDEYDEDEDDDEGGVAPPANELFQLAGLGGKMPTFAPRAPAFPVRQPVVPAPAPAAPPVGLRLNVLPRANVPGVTAPAPVQLTIPRANVTAPAVTAPVQLTIPRANVPGVTIPRANVPFPAGVPAAGTQAVGTAGAVRPVPTPAAPPVPNIPKVAGLVIQPTAPVIAPRALPTAVDVNEILSKMPGITISSVTPAPTPIPADINDLLKKENDETPEDFEARRRLTLQLASIPDYKLNNVTAVTAGLMLMKKSKLGLTYDSDVENALAYLTALLQR